MEQEQEDQEEQESRILGVRIRVVKSKSLLRGKSLKV